MEGKVTPQELLEQMEGHEILSIAFEGCVMVSNGQIIQMGEVIDSNPSDETIKELWGEHFDYEFGENFVSDLFDEFRS